MSYNFQFVHVYVVSACMGLRPSLVHACSCCRGVTLYKSPLYLLVVFKWFSCLYNNIDICTSIRGIKVCSHASGMILIWTTSFCVHWLHLIRPFLFESVSFITTVISRYLTHYKPTRTPIFHIFYGYVCAYQHMYTTRMYFELHIGELNICFPIVAWLGCSRWLADNNHNTKNQMELPIRNWSSLIIRMFIYLLWQRASKWLPVLVLFFFTCGMSHFID